MRTIWWKSKQINLLRQKITEPETPYHPMIDDDDGSLSPVGHGFNDCIGHTMDAEELRSVLKDVASSSRKTTGQSSGWTSSEDEADEEASSAETDRSGMSFQELRKAHYDEFLKIKELRSKGSFLEDEDDDAEGDPSYSLSSSVKDMEMEVSTATVPQKSSAGPTNGL